MTRYKVNAQSAKNTGGFINNATTATANRPRVHRFRMNRYRQPSSLQH